MNRRQLFSALPLLAPAALLPQSEKKRDCTHDRGACMDCFSENMQRVGERLTRNLNFPEHMLKPLPGGERVIPAVDPGSRPEDLRKLLNDMNRMAREERIPGPFPYG